MLEFRIWYIKSLIEFDLVMSTPLTPRVYKEVLEEELLNQLHLVFFIWRLGSPQASTISFLHILLVKKLFIHSLDLHVLVLSKYMPYVMGVDFFCAAFFLFM